MQGGELTNTPATGLPAPDGGTVVDSAVAAPSSTARATASPSLPQGAPAEPQTAETTSTQPTPGADTWYRSDHERTKSVRRRANPWYRRLGRGLVALSLLGVLSIGLYLGAREIQDYLERDRLPSAGAEVPEIRATSFQVRSSSPAPNVDGTMTIDTASQAFEFVGRNGGPQSSVQAVGAGTSSVYIRVSDGEWQLAGSGDVLASDLTTVVRYLSNDDTADAILTNRLRRGYVDLVEQATEGLGDNELTRYELELDTEGFDTQFPLQWREFQGGAIPGVRKTSTLPVIIWLDTDKVLVRVRDEQTNWSWERLTYAETSFEPYDPSAELLEATIDEQNDG